LDSKGTLRICRNGHKYYKSSGCPTCPICESERKTNIGWLDALSAPARRAFEREGITTLMMLAQFSESDILKLHGVGPSSIPKLRSFLKSKGLKYKME